MKLFRIITSCEAITEYTVLAESKNEAIEKFIGGEFETDEITDYSNENIDEVEEIIWKPLKR